MPAQPSARAGQVDIVIAGGGPVGLMLACELRLSGTDPIVLERLPGINQTPKGNGLVGQIVPMLDYRGLLDRLRQDATLPGRYRATRSGRCSWTSPGSAPARCTSWRCRNAGWRRCWRRGSPNSAGPSGAGTN
ncbi:MAG TPA: FAD-dependent monooxygenase [Streptosporangiaceae bacterium]|nr:FAD-dependent monooxygenase [Streptosporangiaceae bacterium]